MVPPLDIISQRFGRLVAIRQSGSDNRGRAVWLCQCDCGNKKEARVGDLRNGRTQSCGCWQSESRKHHTLTHGHSPRSAASPEYKSWATMLTRCTNPNSSNFRYYGGRGIKVCKRWHQFENFLADMGQRPLGLSLDRIDNDGNYEPGNVKWSTRLEQARNKRPRRGAGHPEALRRRRARSRSAADD